jgi:hypothetical protein
MPAPTIYIIRGRNGAGNNLRKGICRVELDCRWRQLLSAFSHRSNSRGASIRFAHFANAGVGPRQRSD